ncbi:hypothetical protein ACK330_10540 [Aeromonas taiwanensis]|uniref:hypothetical protein n=3 Tax=Aeromonas taiwanensis TaxID=633417 RepID=UPI003989EBCA
MRKIYVICPGNTVTGGPELLHQFVSTLNNAGCDASIIYSPFNVDFIIPEPYLKYNIKVAKYCSVDFMDNDCVVIPEIFTGYAKKFGSATKYIWWLSVDNYFEKFPKGFNESIKGMIKRFLNHKNSEPVQIRLDGLKGYKHLVQSKYAEEFLLDKGYKSYMLSDFLNEEHLNKSVNLSLKEDIICFNPKKGIEITKKIIENLPGYKFVPIVNMTSAQVAELLERAKVYIDFGNHPGKDRIPREAAMAYCVVITGTQGSAKNKFDIPVPPKYKIQESSLDFINQVESVLCDAIHSYETTIDDFEEYRINIKNERLIFEKQTLDLFGQISK